MEQQKKRFRSLTRKHLPMSCETEAFDQVFLHPLFQKHSRIAVYAAKKDEMDLSRLVQRLWAMGKKTFFPKVVDSEDMHFVRVRHWNELKEGAFGLQEPKCLVETQPEFLELVLIPGLAFDDFGHRMGRGKGYYDRFLGRHKHLIKIGCCLEQQLHVRVPVDELDQRMNWILTQKRIFAC
ncbi:MAG: 5-formyltetrahydrofolate cyclo-ligase [Bdellovibrionota bacterium]